GRVTRHRKPAQPPTGTANDRHDQSLNNHGEAPTTGAPQHRQRRPSIGKAGHGPPGAGLSPLQWPRRGSSSVLKRTYTWSGPTRGTTVLAGAVELSDIRTKPPGTEARARCKGRRNDEIHWLPKIQSRIPPQHVRRMIRRGCDESFLRRLSAGSARKRPKPPRGSGRGR